MPHTESIASIDRQIAVALATHNGQVTRLRKKKNMLRARQMKAALDGYALETAP